MIQSAVVTQSFRATVAVTPLRPLAVVTAGLVAVAVAASWRLQEAPDVLVMAAPGALAAGVALGLDDEAFRLVGPVPTTAIARLGLRLSVLIPALLASVVGLLIAHELLFARTLRAPSAGAVSALVAAAIAVEVWWSRFRPEGAAEAAAVVVVTWSLSAFVLPPVDAIQAGADAWNRYPLVVLGVSVVAAVIGSLGRAA